MEEKYIGNYKILEKKGAGGMAKVYLAVHKDVPNLKVILKILSDPRLVERFRNEADNLALLEHHPNICRIKDFFSHGDDTVIAMEFIDGSSLDEVIEHGGRMSITEAIRITNEVLDILGFAHQKGVYHRDIKPGNIMLEKSGQIKIIDFGIAKSETDPNLTAAGSACGTPTYMSPEQFNPPDDINYALTDIYAVGTTLFWLLTGEVPFKGDNEFAIRDAKMFNDPPSPRKLNSEISKPLERIILKALAKDPKNRFSSTEDMHNSLKQFEAGTTAKRAASDDKTMDISEDNNNNHNGRNWKPIVFSVLAMIIVLGVAAWWLWLYTPEEPAQGWAEIEISPLADSVLFDDSLVASRAFSVSIEGSEGQHELRLVNLEAENSPIKKTVTLTANRTEELSYDFIIPGTTPPVPFTLTGKVQISISPTADSVFFDNKLVDRGTTSVLVEGTEGEHNLKLVKAKATNSPITRSVTILANQTVQLNYRFNMPTPAPKPQKPIPARGSIVAASRPRGATVYIDGVKQSQITVYTFKVSAGTHIVELRHESQTYSDTVQVNGDETVNVFYEFEN
ncbi:MAG: hypothetical protein DRP47_08725 [Candidatus Zixiibacteriota bacterium]|nr:MAG: hypothetical protein DRP47_08725 [candidate division Zixibacteria bacterium]